MWFTRLFVAWIFIVASASMSAALTAQECSDMRELYGTEPSECSNPALVAEKTTLSEPTVFQRENNVFFPQGGTALDGVAREQVATLARMLNGDILGETCLALVGHSDSSGGAKVNLQVSKSRAMAVQRAFDALLENPSQIEKVVGMGESRALVGLPPESKWQRRVELRARRCDF